MPYKYVLKWRQDHKEYISVEAWPRYDEDENKRPAFIIGRVNGQKAVLISHLAEKAHKKYGGRRYGPTLRIELPAEESEAYELAYRTGLAAAVLEKASDGADERRICQYVLEATPEEVWFWTSKLLDDRVHDKAMRALSILGEA